jgi:hypothetical protein
MKDTETIMGGDDQFHLEYSIIEKACGLDYNDYLKDKRILTRELFELNFEKVNEIIEDYSNFKFHTAYQVLGRFILLLGARITEDIRALIIDACDWIYEEDTWPPWSVAERKFRLKDLENKIKKYKNGNIDPIEEDLVFYSELVSFYRLKQN